MKSSFGNVAVTVNWGSSFCNQWEKKQCLLKVDVVESRGGGEGGEGGVGGGNFGVNVCDEGCGICLIIIDLDNRQPPLLTQIESYLLHIEAGLL